MTIDIFAEVLDNYGDIAVVYRLAKDIIRRYPGLSVRIFTDNLAAFKKINPLIDHSKAVQCTHGIGCISTHTITSEHITEIGAGDAVIEAFGTYVPDAYMDYIQNADRRRLILNLEYFTAEPWIQDYHLKESLTGFSHIKKYFFMPGLADISGGVIIDTGFIEQRDSVRKNRESYRAEYVRTINGTEHFDDSTRIITVFTYETNLVPLVRDLLTSEKPALLVCMDRYSQASINPVTEKYPFYKEGELYTCKNVSLFQAPFYTQEYYDRLICMSDLNIVRGEESFARALLSKTPFLWHAYLQDDGYQIKKVDAFMAYYKKFFTDTALYGAMYRLFHVINNRTENSVFVPSDADYSDVLSKLPDIRTINSALADELVDRHDLVPRLYSCITEYFNRA